MAEDVVLPFYVAWACKQMLEKALKPGVEGNLRGVVNRQFRELYEQDNMRRHDVELYGVNVGAYTFSQSRAVPAHDELRVVAYDYERILNDDNPDFAEWLKDHVRNHIGELAESYVRETGDSVDGVDVHWEHVAETPSAVKEYGDPKGVTPEKVAEAMGTDPVGLLEVATRLLSGTQALPGTAPRQLTGDE